MSGFGHRIVIAAVALSCLIFAAGCKKDKSADIGTKAPEISVLDLNDRTVRLLDFSGKVVVLRFWSSGCSACVAEMPALDEFYKRYKEKGLVVCAVNTGDPRGRVEKFVRELKISYPVLLDPVSITAQKYRVKAVPTTFLIDREGVAKKVFVGETAPDLLEKAVSGLL